MTRARTARQKKLRVEFGALRSDWYFGVDYVVRLVHAACLKGGGDVTFCGFPRQWIALFEWLELDWADSIAPSTYIPFVSELTEAQIRREVAVARARGQLRQLVETIAASDIVLGDALQRLDISTLPTIANVRPEATIPLTTWHSYTRPEVVAFERDLATWRPSKDKAIFMPCGRARPYDSSATHRRLLQKLKSWQVPVQDYDLIVITSLGPVPEALWKHDTVLKYDTGVRDIYRMLILLRRLLTRRNVYSVALDCLGFRPYRDLLRIVSQEGLLRELKRPGPLRTRTIPPYKFPPVRPRS